MKSYFFVLSNKNLFAWVIGFIIIYLLISHLEKNFIDNLHLLFFGFTPGLFVFMFGKRIVKVDDNKYEELKKEFSNE